MDHNNILAVVLAGGKSKRFGKDKSQVKELNEISEDDLILDIGPKTIDKIKDIIQSSETVLWNGPAGFF